MGTIFTPTAAATIVPSLASMAIATDTTAGVVAALGLLPELVKLLPKSNSARAAEELQQHLQDDKTREAIHSEVMKRLAPNWENRPEEERPTADDVVHGFMQLMEARGRAHDHQKRRILFNAFWNSFKPEFYDEGLGNILWAKVEELEYPDFVYLKKLLDAQNPANRRFIRENAMSPDYEFMKRLEERRLVSLSEDTTGVGGTFVVPAGIASLLAKFALEQLWSPEPTT